jgi:SNF2 family DNA or RNA helicase
VTALHLALTDDRQKLILMAVGESAHDLAAAAQRLQTLTPAFAKSDPPGALLAPLTWPLVVQLEATFGGQLVKHPDVLGWIAEEAAARTSSLTPALPDYVPVPDGLTPRPYQVAGALEIARTGSALIFDEPRTGKTITTILGLSVNAGPQQLKGLPILVVCPASVVDPWVEEFTRWAPYWRTVAWRGPKRTELAGTADVYVTSYDTARADAHEMATALVKLEARTLVADETHFLKNPSAHRTRAVKRLARKVDAAGGSFVGLSGTPITHHTGDLHPTLACLEPGAWPSRERMVSRYCQVLPGDYEDTILGLHPATEPEFRLTLLGQHRRVARADVMADLPPKTYSVRTVDLPPKWRKAYDDFEEQMLAELPDEGGELSVMDSLSVLSHLSALSSAAADVEVTYGPDLDQHTEQPKKHVHLELKAPSWKVDALLEILEERPGEKVVVFAGERAQLARLAGAAAEAAGHRVGYIIGGQSQKVRTETRQAFQDGDLNLICATTGAGGTGITLSAAGTLVFLQRPWSLVESLQAEDRAEGDLERSTALGRGTEVIDVVARNTIDTRRRAVLRERAGQLSELLQDPRIVAELLGGSNVTRTERKAS